MRERLGEGERETERERETQTLGVKGELRDEKAMRPTGADGDSPPRATVAPPRALLGSPWAWSSGTALLFLGCGYTPPGPG